MKTIIHRNPSFELAVDLEQNKHGVNFRLITLVTTARTPGDHLKFQATLSIAELTNLRDAIKKVLSNAVASATI